MFKKFYAFTTVETYFFVPEPLWNSYISKNYQTSD